MKKRVSCFFACMLSFFAFAQTNNQTAEILGTTFNTRNYHKIIAEYDLYWQNNANRTKKGSGFKVYQRWKEYWAYYLNSDSTLMTGAEIEREFLIARMVGKSLSKTADSIDNSNWIPLGPFTHENQGSWSSGQGRVNVSTVDPNNPNTIYIGAPNGGIWKTTDNGSTWKIICDSTIISGVSGIAVDYNDPNIIYVSTGDEDTDENPTVGIFKTTNGGQTWTKTNFPTNVLKTGEILINPNNPNMLWLVSSGGIFKSIDAGNNWVRKYNFVSKEIRLMPGNPATIYAVSIVGSTVSFLKSTDEGETFTVTQTFTNAGRTVMAVTPANPNYVYLLVSNNNKTFKGIYKSTDRGQTFIAQNTSTDIYDGATQSDYDLAIAASDVNAEIIFTGCLNIWKSTNGGLNFTRYNNWSNPSSAQYTHADIHDLKFYNKKLYAGTDGGIYVSDIGVNTFTDFTINGLNISQFYRLDVAQSKITGIAGGLQDNGGYSFANNAWVNYHGADGMDAAIDPTNINQHYGFIQNGGSLYNIDVSIPGDGGFFAANGPFTENGNWITPLEFGNNGTLYAGYRSLYRFDFGSFTKVSTQTFTNNIKQIRVHPSNDLIVLLSDESRLYISDGTENYQFKQLTTLPIGNLKNFDFNRNNPAIIYAMSNAGIYKSMDTGNTWINITYNLPIGAKNALVHQASSYNNTVYVATNKAVYYINDSLTEWKLFSNNIPNTTITDIEINNIENHVLISTYGRGIWRSPVALSSLKVKPIDPNPTDTNMADLVLFPNPVRDIAHINTTIDEPVTLKVFNMAGQLMLNQNFETLDRTTNLDFTHLATGTYVLNLTSAKHLITKMFIKY